MAPNKEPFVSLDLIPESSAKPQPDYIPRAIREDYFEASRILDLSPKAAATLARRCLQGMIRDFCSIKKPTLFREIEALKAAVEDSTAPRYVTLESVEAIDRVRSIGNIGAHMEADVDLIVDVDPDEAQLLLDLIESLFADWYVERHVRAARFAKIAEVADAKAAALKKGREAKASPKNETGS